MSSTRQIIAVIVCWLSGSVAAHGQVSEPIGYLSGKFIDLSGLPVANEPITLEKQPTPIALPASTTVSTLNDGRFSFSGLHVGIYKIMHHGKEVVSFEFTGKEYKLPIDIPDPNRDTKAAQFGVLVAIDLANAFAKNPATKCLYVALKRGLEKAGVVVTTAQDVSVDTIPMEFRHQ
jgi:hypothetical protein